MPDHRQAGELPWFARLFALRTSRVLVRDQSTVAASQPPHGCQNGRRPVLAAATATATATATLADPHLLDLRSFRSEQASIGNGAVERADAPVR